MCYRRGFYEIGIYHIKSEVNIGTLWRSAYQLGASGIFTIGKRYSRQSSDTTNATAHLPLRHYITFDELMNNRPNGARLVGVEFGGKPLSEYTHPEQAIYILGAEDHGLPDNIINQCNDLITIESIRQPSFNVSVAGSIIMYHRTFGKWHPANDVKGSDAG